MILWISSTRSILVVTLSNLDKLRAGMIAQTAVQSFRTSCKFISKFIRLQAKCWKEQKAVMAKNKKMRKEAHLFIPRSAGSAVGYVH